MRDSGGEETGGHSTDVIAAPGWAAVYVRDGREFAWPLVAWLHPTAGVGLLVVGLALSLDCRPACGAATGHRRRRLLSVSLTRRRPPAEIGAF